MKIVFATNNKNKVKEVKAMLPDDIEILSLKDIGCTEEIVEDADTIEGNARIKADYVTKNYGYDCFADDTGLEVDALNGAPGVYSARYAGEEATYEDNVEKMLKEMKGKSDRKARFVTVAALNLEGKQYLFKGVCEGKILKEKRGHAGFGYDPIFQPEGFKRSFAEMDLEEKGKISHRGKAMKKLITFLLGYNSDN
ncbi:MAG: non-canonical purine NTP pyrophosphatase [Flavobacteriia bacterium]|nr:MAG: non-canonical purine NTP pyrophosphatase [Flavobacteriia bacterium]